MRRAPSLVLLCTLLLAPRADAANAVVRFTTVLGHFDVELCTEVSAACPGVAPNTVANFLRYVDENVYPETMFIHRRGAGPPTTSPLVIQGGGYYIDGGMAATVTPFASIDLELGAHPRTCAEPSRWRAVRRRTPQRASGSSIWSTT